MSTKKMTTEKTTFEIELSRKEVIDLLMQGYDGVNSCFEWKPGNNHNAGHLLGVDDEGVNSNWEWFEKNYNDGNLSNSITLIDLLNQDLSLEQDLTDYLYDLKAYNERAQNQDYQDCLNDNDKKDSKGSFLSFIEENQEDDHQALEDIHLENTRDYLFGELKNEVTLEDFTIKINWID